MNPMHTPHLLFRKCFVYTGLFHVNHTILVPSYGGTFLLAIPVSRRLSHLHLWLLFQNVIDRHLACTSVSFHAFKWSQLMPCGIRFGSCTVLPVLKRLLSHCRVQALNSTNTLENIFPLGEKVELVRELPELVFPLSEREVS